MEKYTQNCGKAIRKKQPKNINSYHFDSSGELISVNNLPEIIGKYTVVYALNLKNALRKFYKIS